MKNIKHIKRWILLGTTTAVFLCIVIGACTKEVKVTSPEVSPFTPAPTPSPPEEITSSSQLYSTKVTPLTPVQCGQCHTTIYNNIKDDGTKHQIDCRECHQQFHICYVGKTEYKELLPQCGTCHQEPHGKDFTTGCSECHHNAHTPKKIVSSDTLEKFCGNCHTKEKSLIKAKPSKHTKMACSECHTEHALIPECGVCHKPHQPEMTNTDCLTCHPAHTPLYYVYSEKTPQETCSICHQKAYDDLQTT
ncbi:MAG: hypothetical protein SVW57_11715, partial [Thermodesulfobacteriota bacterium]|nr:hypothetical protein [Thermodesulfobacteriota bacterium]